MTISTKLSISNIPMHSKCMPRLQLPHKSVRCCQDCPQSEVSVVEPVPLCPATLTVGHVKNFRQPDRFNMASSDKCCCHQYRRRSGFHFFLQHAEVIFWLRGPRSYGRQSYIGRPALPVSYPLALSDLPADLGVAIYNFRPGGGKMPTSRILDLWIPN